MKKVNKSIGAAVIGITSMFASNANAWVEGCHEYAGIVELFGNNFIESEELLARALSGTREDVATINKLSSSAKQVDYSEYCIGAPKNISTPECDLSRAVRQVQSSASNVITLFDAMDKLENISVCFDETLKGKLTTTLIKMTDEFEKINRKTLKDKELLTNLPYIRETLPERVHNFR